MSKLRDRLLKAAEILFSEREFHDVSVREIAGHAKANVGLIAYYFGGKRGLFDEVLRIHAESLSHERMKRLKSLMVNSPNPSVEEILKAWFLPWLQLEDRRRLKAVHLRITANMSHEKLQDTKAIWGSSPDVTDAFISALRSRLLHLSADSVMYRLQFIASALVYGLWKSSPLIAISGGGCDPSDLEASFNQILPFACAGFCAPEPRKLRKPRFSRRFDTPANADTQTQRPGMPAGG